MWEFLAKQLLKQAGKNIGNSFFSDEASGPEVYADRIKRDFKFNDYAEAWALYDSDREFWERYYRELPSPDWKKVTVQDSAAAAGVPSRNNVFEYGFPESRSVPNPSSEAPPLRKLSTWYVRPDGSTEADNLAGRISRPAAIDPSNAGWPAPSPSTGFGGANGDLRPSRVLDTGTSPIPYLPLASQRAPRGLPALLAEFGAFDPSNPEAPPSGGLPGLIQEYLRNR